MLTRVLRKLRRLHPNLLLIGGFLSAIGVGAILLHSGFSLQGSPLSMIDALFTATSAVCVTGLTVVDTGTRFNTTGQMVLLLLIQLGGLGIMTYTTVVILLLGKRLSIKERELVHGTLSHRLGQQVSTLVKYVFLVTLVFETLGLILLYVRWRAYFSPVEAFIQALFHSISAFCNAGFSLFPASLMDFRYDPWINLVIMALIVSGGIGFLVIQEVYQYAAARLSRKKKFRFSLHSRVVLTTTAWLILGGLAGFLVLEWHNTLHGNTVQTKVLTSLFQSITPRTAGFNTVDYNHLTNGTLLFTMFLMFIGASPGSAGGGIKTTSFAVLVGLARAKSRTREETFLFRRTVPSDTVARTVSILLISMTTVLAATMALMITELGDVQHPASRGLFLEYLFEAVSAFGTVGLSTGVTSSLSAAGKAIIMLLMFVGRVGPITIALAISGERREAGFTYPEEDIMVG